jgi:Eukaryotic aspartyl protease
VTVNGKTSYILQQHQDFVFDSGTSNLVFSTNITEVHINLPKSSFKSPLTNVTPIQAIFSLISSEIQPNLDEPGAYGIPCSQVTHLPAFISFSFTDQNGNPFNLTVPSSELSVGPFNSNSSLCQTLINAEDG